jgi:uncharacterized membrane protein
VNVSVMRSVAAVPLAGMLVACGESQPEPWQLAQDSATQAAWAAAETGDVLKGILLYRRDGWSFSGCRTPGVSSRLTDSAGVVLTDVAQGFQPKPGDALFAELRVPPGSAGPDLTVRQVRRLTRVNEGGSCAELPPAFVFRAFGSEPYWSAEVGPERIVYTTPESPSGIAFDEVAPRWAGAKRVYQGFRRGQGERLIEVRVSREGCRDGVSGAYFAYSAEVRLRSGTRTGCARGGIAEPASMAQLTR